MVYISITGLRIKNWISIPIFWWYAIPAKMQADSAAGVIFSDAKEVNSYQHTLTAWKSRKAMLAFLTSGAHIKAMKVFKDVASDGKTYGYESDTIPSWEEALVIWEKHGKSYGGVH